jgi:hypothetical protein
MGQEGQNINQSNPFIAAAVAALGLGAVECEAGVGEFGVYVLNLWDDSDPNRRNPAQDQLIYAPQVNPNTLGVPDGGTTAMLLGLGFSAVAVIRRIRRS